MAAVAVLAACLGLMRVLRCGPTFYAPGFTEAKFAELRQGMSASRLNEILGPPLETIQQHDGTSLWTYSDRRDNTCDFEMRWVYLRDGKIEQVVAIHWDD